jgi:hypothetical protein
MQVITQWGAISPGAGPKQNDGTYAIYAAMKKKKRRHFNCFIIGDKQSAFAVWSLLHQ